MRLILRGALPLLLCVVVLVLIVPLAEGVDCRKRPFAPKCRGVSAKRGFDVGRESEKDDTYQRPYEYDPTDYFWDERPGDAGYGQRISDDGFDHRALPSPPPYNKYNTDNTDQGRFLRALVKMYFERRPELKI